MEALGIGRKPAGRWALFLLSKVASREPKQADVHQNGTLGFRRDN
jgi:hypothetical protein